MKLINFLKNTFLNFSLRTKIFILLSFLSLISLAYIALVSLRLPGTLPPPPTPSIQSQNPALSKLKPSQISFSNSAVFPQLPSTLPIHSASSRPQDISTLAAPLADYFRLQKSPDRPNLWSNSDQAASLSYSSDPQVITYQNFNPSFYTGRSRPLASGAISAAKSLLSSFPNWKDFQPDLDHLSFLHANDVHFDTATPDDYDVILVPVSPTLNSFPLRLSGQTAPYFLIYVGQNNQIIKLTITPQDISVGPQSQNLPVLPPDEARAQVLAGQAQIVHSSYFDATYLTPAPLPPLTIDQITVEYRFETSNSRLIPYYTFRGSTTDSPPNTLYLTLPAVKLEPA